eukprot:m.362932 g.362932  ORF g.362932 m.362932 type:complete len:59 (+) comp20793_c0_seq3:1728-1904(+)
MLSVLSVGCVGRCGCAHLQSTCVHDCTVASWLSASAYYIEAITAFANPRDKLSFLGSC